MKRGVVICDAGPIFSLALVAHLQLLDKIFDEVFISQAVWDEITRDKSADIYPMIKDFFRSRIRQIKSTNHLLAFMDYGESEAVILYGEANADLMLVDDKKARLIAEDHGVHCIGTIGLFSAARSFGLIEELLPIFKDLLNIQLAF